MWPLCAHNYKGSNTNFILTMYLYCRLANFRTRDGNLRYAAWYPHCPSSPLEVPIGGSWNGAFEVSTSKINPHHHHQPIKGKMYILGKKFLLPLESFVSQLVSHTLRVWRRIRHLFIISRNFVHQSLCGWQDCFSYFTFDMGLLKWQTQKVPKDTGYVNVN